MKEKNINCGDYQKKVSGTGCLMLPACHRQGCVSVGIEIRELFDL
jgi:hypothetical protein